MLFRFCLYGFLKNQQYYDPFIILAFLEKGLSFSSIGILIGFRELCINILEVPTGVIADLAGRRKSMVLSFLGYIGAFIIFGLCSRMWLLFAAMFLFSIGEAFRTGTHKAIIFDWLERNNRGHEKTRIYGQTRSWSKFGSAVSVIIAALLVFRLNSYSYVFLFSIAPYLVNIINLLSYPAYLDGPRAAGPSFVAAAHALGSSLRKSLRNRPLRRLLLESMGFEGCHRVAKDYLQPLLKTMALALPILVGLADRQRTALLVAVVYFLIYIFSASASRHADVLVKRAGSEQKGATWLWIVNSFVFAVISIGILARRPYVAVAGFVVLTVLQNFWRPILVGRVAANAEPENMATILSMESQAKTLFAAVAAPVLGFAVDLTATTVPDSDWRFLPVGILGLITSLLILATGRRARIPNSR
jgi:MFS family permease